jgi:hypothetical protein
MRNLQWNGNGDSQRVAPDRAVQPRPQPSGAKTRTVEAGSLTSFAAGLTGRRSNPPPQFGHTPPSRSSTQSAQNVHSYVQIRASGDSGGRSRSQHSHEGRSSSTARS